MFKVNKTERNMLNWIGSNLVQTCKKQNVRQGTAEKI